MNGNVEGPREMCGLRSGRVGDGGREEGEIALISSQSKNPRRESMQDRSQPLLYGRVFAASSLQSPHAYLWPRCLVLYPRC